MLVPFVLAVTVAAALSAAQQDEPRPPSRAAIERGEYERAEALALERLQRVRADGAESLAAAQAADDYVDALILNGKGALSSTLSMATETAALRQRVGAADARDLPVTLINLGRVLALAMKYDHAIYVLLQAVAVASLHQGESPAAFRTALDALARLLERRDELDDAHALLNYCMALQESAAAPDRERARTLQVLAAVHHANSSYREARNVLERAQAYHARAGADHPAAIETWVQLGSQFWFEGRLAESRTALTTAVNLAERTLRPDHPSTAYALRKLASTMLDLGDTAAARALYQRALSMVERSLGPDHVEVAAFVNGLAEVSRRAGDYPAARRGYERALTIAQPRLGRHDWVATFVHNLALVHSSLGDFAAARREHQRAMKIWEAIRGRNNQLLTVPMSEMALAWRDDGAPAAAVPLLERVLAIRRHAFGDQHREVVRALVDLAVTRDRLGQTARARDLLARAIKTLDAMPDPPAPDVAGIYALSAELAARRGDYETAAGRYTRAREIYADLFGVEHPLVAQVDAGLAVAHAALGDPTAGFDIAARAEAIGREHVRLTLRYLPERESLNFQRRRPRGLDLMLSVASASPGFVAPALDAVIRGRALVFDEMVGRRRIADVEGADLAGQQTLYAARQRLANIIVRGPAGNPAEHRAVLETAQRESELAERELAASSAAFQTELGRAQVGLDQVRAALPPDAALVSFLRFDRIFYERSRRPGARAALRRVPSYVAFVVRAGVEPRAFVLGSAREIDRLVAIWRSSIAAEAGVPGAAASSDSRTVGTHLRRRIWDRIRTALGSTNRIFIVPDGAISLVSFAALPDGTRSYLIEREPSLHYLIAERDVITRPRPSSARGLLAIGGASFGAKPAAAPSSGSGAAACPGLSALTFEPLEGSLEEARQIARIWSAASGDPASARILAAEDAREEAFAKLAPEARVLHLATHGFSMSAECLPSLPGTRGVGGLVALRPAAPRASDVPDVSALAFARANRRASARPDQADGILIAEEVAALPLGGVEWAVLSACDTGLGRPVAGEGVLGLRRAFQIAGVRTVIMTLWPIDDRATARFMRELYTARFVKGLATDEAIRTASLTVLRARRARGESTHPFLWAAFVAAGDWR